MLGHLEGKLATVFHGGDDGFERKRWQCMPSDVVLISSHLYIMVVYSARKDYLSVENHNEYEQNSE